MYRSSSLRRRRSSSKPVSVAPYPLMRGQDVNITSVCRAQVGLIISPPSQRLDRSKRLFWGALGTSELVEMCRRLASPVSVNSNYRKSLSRAVRIVQYRVQIARAID